MEILERNTITSLVRDCTVGVGGVSEEFDVACLETTKKYIADELGVDALTREQRRFIEAEFSRCIMDMHRE